MVAKEGNVVRDRRVALGFRIGGFLLALCGLLDVVGVFAGQVNGESFMYYTIQTNLLALGLFGLLGVRTILGLRESRTGSAGWFSRLEMVIVVDVLVTLVVFWTLLAPSFDADYLWSFSNLGPHTLTPLACLADYVLFSPAKKLKYKDVFFTCLYPGLYLALVTIAGFSGYVYYWQFDQPWSSAPTPVRFPYFFLDYDRIGAWVLLYANAATAFYLLLGHLFYLVDKKVRRAPLVENLS